jgi:hypothetical protein
MFVGWEHWLGLLQRNMHANAATPNRLEPVQSAGQAQGGALSRCAAAAAEQYAASPLLD